MWGAQLEKRRNESHKFHKIITTIYCLYFKYNYVEQCKDLATCGMISLQVVIFPWLYYTKRLDWKVMQKTDSSKFYCCCFLPSFWSHSKLELENLFSSCILGAFIFSHYASQTKKFSKPQTRKHGYGRISCSDARDEVTHRQHFQRSWALPISPHYTE